MIIYDVCRCDNCLKVYKGQFEFHVDGKVTCVDCQAPNTYAGLAIDEVAYTQQNQTLYNELSEMLLMDLSHLYPLYPEAYTEVMHYLSNTSIDSTMGFVYYQYNPFHLVRVVREMAYVSSYYVLQYRDKPDIPTELLRLYQQADEFIKYYLALRDRLLTEAEVQAYWGLLASEEVQQIKQVLNGEIT